MTQWQYEEQLHWVDVLGSILIVAALVWFGPALLDTIFEMLVAIFVHR